MSAAFDNATRLAIYTAGDHRCVGCGRPDITAQHRRARGMGGSRRAELGQAPNGVPLCGHGTAGCHGWTEHHPTEATLLGWRLTAGQDPLDEPYWTRFGWRRWTLDHDCYLVAYVDPLDLDHPLERTAAVAAHDARTAGWR